MQTATGPKILAQRGDRQEEACAAAKKLLEINPKFSVEGALKALPYKNEADLKLVVDALRESGLK